MKWLKQAGVGLVFMLGSGVITSGSARADIWEDQVRAQLLFAGTAATSMGLKLTHDPFLGSLPHNTREDITLTLRSGVSYIILGVCDTDCHDLDLELYDAKGRLVVQDHNPDDSPTLTATPTSTGRYRIRVMMPSCSDSPCRYGVGVFGI